MGQGRIRQTIKLLFLLLSLVVIAACSTEEVIVEDRVSPIFEGPAEISYCSSPISYSTSYTITGTATFTPRKPYFTGSGGLGAEGSAEAIRYAEVRITDSNGSVIQCAETDSSGNFSFTVPQSGANYTISVNARADNNFVKISVLNTPETNTVYSLTSAFTADSTKSVGTINASATGSDVLAGAFNIYNQILESNEYLRTQVGTCSISGCDNFVVAPKVSAYWVKGFNPGSYYNAGPVSFYIPGYSRLFILGGLNGDVDNSDTDHFDNSIIIHEYGHFLEDVMSDSDSPGGSHSGNKLIDPRLAWSEGFANFLQAAVQDDPKYVDTTGNISGSTGLIFEVNLESYGSCSSSTPGCDKPNKDAEGNFREFAITRMLWDAVDNTPAETENSQTDNVSGKFDEIWASMVRSDGFKNTNSAFRSVGLFNHIQAQTINITDFSNLRTMHGMLEDTASYYRGEYAHYVDDGGSCSMNFSVTPVYECVITTSEQCPPFYLTDFVANVDFYHYKHPGGSLSLQLNYTTPSGTEADLDLYLFNTSSNIGVQDSQVTRSIEAPNGTIGDTESESFSVSVDAGDYLIAVFAFGGKGSATNYEIKAGGSDLCPAALP